MLTFAFVGDKMLEYAILGCFVFLEISRAAQMQKRCM